MTSITTLTKSEFGADLFGSEAHSSFQPSVRTTSTGQRGFVAPDYSISPHESIDEPSSSVLLNKSWFQWLGRSIFKHQARIQVLEAEVKAKSSKIKFLEVKIEALEDQAAADRAKAAEDRAKGAADRDQLMQLITRLQDDVARHYSRCTCGAS
ncbi:hypothetical protein BCR33DRAFT_723256 [Rhizoclosmatium globosum]|uniref:Uncharacterized protein n=1 Tax=Rhizoclosmatium globosum TaxID=329046 RepID=A0A1Y2BEL8_9FUNG|nr:hypothetical protein BCR33DRAFT_723256 [Rhizoclosmatium globosum]|eukprot:ORY33282.1 hypothetical protein BCR33DRAFT_723256 [Rhizoclosmatium globosum]